ncbi:MAG: ADP-glyceromanno-heptose 6-epimerase [Bacteroidales bacterium]|jgi:ADP-L-glycero-D-manno-heptose 6-epimerase|nr:ADP-glyceromanno-heptose 6-epimerase [Bacteroidales bacterium]
MIAVTGAAGFIGSVMVKELNELGFDNIIIVDDFGNAKKQKNWQNLHYAIRIERDIFPKWAELNAEKIDYVFHLGARTDTTEFDYDVFKKLNVDYSKAIWEFCTRHNKGLVYASSAATYGNGEQGYNDDTSLLSSLSPLNPYGKSKQEFDIWVLQQEKTPPYWYGLKFFNVYGFNEYHKGRMASVVFHGFNQIEKEGKISLFRSHREGIADGYQLRDFIYVKDLVSVMAFLMRQKPKSDIYNLGTGKARAFLDLAKATFAALNKEPNIEFIDMPLDIRDKYQYFTQANMRKLHSQAGYNKPFYSLEEGVRDYVQNYLMKLNAN